MGEEMRERKGENRGVERAAGGVLLVMGLGVCVFFSLVMARRVSWGGNGWWERWNEWLQELLNRGGAVMLVTTLLALGLFGHGICVFVLGRRGIGPVAGSLRTGWGLLTGMVMSDFILGHFGSMFFAFGGPQPMGIWGLVRSGLLVGMPCLCLGFAWIAGRDARGMLWKQMWFFLMFLLVAIGVTVTLGMKLGWLLTWDHLVNDRQRVAWFPVAGLVMTAGVLWGFGERYRRMRASEIGPECAGCGYDLTGTMKRMCPECGREVGEREVGEWSRDKRVP